MAKPIQSISTLNKKESAKFLKKMKKTEKRKPTKDERELVEDIKKNFGESNIIISMKKRTDSTKIGSLISVLAGLDIVEKIRASFPITIPIKKVVKKVKGSKKK